MESVTAVKGLRVDVNNRQILSIALPISLSILVPQINMLTNSIFLGRLSEEALGNAGITGVFYLIFAVAGNGMNNALQTVFSRSAGSNNPEHFKTILSQGIRISLVFAAICIAFTWGIAPYIMQQVADPAAYPEEMNFLRIRIFGLPFLYLFQMGNAFLVASLNSRLLIVGFMCEALVNIVLDYFLIFGNGGFPKLGFNGAAVASVAAEITGMFVVFAVIYATGLRKKYNLLRSFKYNRIVQQQILKVSVPLVAQYLISVTTWLVFFLLIESRGIEAKAISNVMRNVFGISGVFVWAFAATTSVMVSNIIGQGKEHMVLPLVRRIMFWSLGLCLIMCGLLNLLPHLFFRLFGQSEAFVRAGVPVIRMVSLGLIFMSIANVWLNAVTGTGRTRINLGIELVAITLYMSYTWYFMKVNYISLPVAWSNEFAYWTGIVLMSVWYMRSGKWKGNKMLPDKELPTVT